MANRYSRYQLQPYQSTYVDPQVVKVNEILAQRYDVNKNTKDIIDRTLGSLEVMKGDEALIEKLKTNIRSKLQNYTEQGNFEDASLEIQDAVTMVETDHGLKLARQSILNRKKEIEWIREMDQNGITVWDFGRGAAENHVSYYYDGTSGEFVDNVYTPQSQPMLEYDNEMRSLLVAMPPTETATAEYIGRSQTERSARYIYDLYKETNAGKQDFRRLMEIELPQDIDPKDREKLAKNSIMNRIRKITRQYEYYKDKTPTNANNKGTGILGSLLVQSSGVSTDVNGTETDHGNQYTGSSLIDGVLGYKSLHDAYVAGDITKEDYEKETNFLTYTIHNTISSLDKNGHLENANYTADAFEDLFQSATNNGMPTLGPIVFYQTTKYNIKGPSGDKIGSDVDWWQTTKKTGVGAGAGALLSRHWIGAVVGGVGFGTIDLFQQMEGNGLHNVRGDLLRSKTFEGGPVGDNQWFGGRAFAWMSDSESQQAIENIIGPRSIKNTNGEIRWHKVDWDGINQRLGTNLKDNDEGRNQVKFIQKYVHDMYALQVGGVTRDVNVEVSDGQGGTKMVTKSINLPSGDDVNKIASNKGGMILTQSTNTFGSSADMLKGRSNVDKTIRKMSPYDFIFEGHPPDTPGWEQIIYDNGDPKTGKNMWVDKDNGVEFMDIVQADPMNGLDTRFKVRINGKEYLVRPKSSVSGQIDDIIINSMGAGFLLDQQTITNNMNNIRNQGGVPTVGDYLQNQSLAAANLMPANSTEEAFINAQIVYDQKGSQLVQKTIFDNSPATRNDDYFSWFNWDRGDVEDPYGNIDIGYTMPHFFYDDGTGTQKRANFFNNIEHYNNWLENPLAEANSINYAVWDLWRSTNSTDDQKGKFDQALKFILSEPLHVHRGQYSGM